MENLALLDCPFCGGQPVYNTSDPTFHEDASVRCQKCGVVVLTGYTSAPTEEGVGSKWNRRSVLESASRDWSGMAKTPEVKAIIQAFTAEVNRRAENRRSLTGKTVGPHLHAMREISQEIGV